MQKISTRIQNEFASAPKQQSFPKHAFGIAVALVFSTMGSASFATVGAHPPPFTSTPQELEKQAMQGQGEILRQQQRDEEAAERLRQAVYTGKRNAQALRGAVSALSAADQAIARAAIDRGEIKNAGQIAGVLSRDKQGEILRQQQRDEEAAERLRQAVYTG
ncbi:hypothetical protein, partial [Pandoraea fibrosis]|uniref:hypothetical protein n=1 Tax=Pandoraea fibrosis TaxID=1891094 RepID=UPI00123FFE1F